MRTRTINPNNVMPHVRRVLGGVRTRAARLFGAEVQVGRRRIHVIKPTLVLLTAAVFALPTFITINLKHAGEDGIEATGHLQSYITQVRIQDAVEWRLLGGGMTQKEALATLVESRESAEHHLEEALELGLPSGVAAHLSGLNLVYTTAVDAEARLLASGQQKEAVELDESVVDPAFEATITDLDVHAEQMEDQAKTAQGYGDLGVLLTVLVSLLLVSVVQSRRRRADVRSQAQRQGEARYRKLIDQSPDLVLVVDRAGRADFLSPSVERLLAPPDQSGVKAPEAPPRASADSGLVDFVTAVDPQDQERFSSALQTAVAGHTTTGEFRLSGKNGVGTFEVTVQDLSADPSVGGLVLNAHDVTERLAMQHQMEHRALHDELTGMPNRALLSDRFEQALLTAERAGTSVALLLLDLDRFKEVNDTFGHHYGDELLRQIGPRLTGVLRSVDTIARLGGDEFAVLLQDVHDVDDAVKVANTLLTALSIPFHVDGVDLDVEASVGVVISGEHGEDAITLMQHADIAMYVAKGQHLGVFAYDPTVDSHSATKLAMVGDLRRALDRDELVLYYQPKVNVSTGDLVGAEALVRWQHPEHGLVFPDEFIPLAERTGLINPLTRYIMDAALVQARTWVESGRPLPIAVNLSARNLHDERFAEIVSELLAIHDVPPSLLELEVTESAIMIDPVRARKMLEKLSDLGVRLSLDDFGAGYTSLSQLKALPIDEIKIDRSFVMTMNEDRRDSLIVQSVISLGHNLGLTLVAEGVETETALSALAGFGCDVFQGYHMTRPIPVDAFDTWSAERSIRAVPPRHVRDPAASAAAPTHQVTLSASVTNRALSFAGGVTRGDDNQSDHVVFFFHGRQELLHEVTRYVSNGLNYDGHAIVITTSEHKEALRAKLPSVRLERAERDGHFLALDAKQTLALFMVDGSPDPVLFERHVGSVVRSHLSETGVLSVYCDLAAVLCKEGNLIGALGLEELWNDLQNSITFSLFCAHPLAEVRADPGDGLAQICLRHTHVHMSQPVNPDTNADADADTVLETA